MDQSSNIASTSVNPENGALATITSPTNTSGAGDEAGVGTSTNDAPTSNVLINSHPLDLYVPPFGFKCHTMYLILIENRDFGEEIVSIFVGKKRKKYLVHKKRVCNSCLHLKKAFEG